MTDAEPKRIVDLVYGKDKEAKVLRNMKIGQDNAKRKFLEKYPDADVSKFKFEVKLTDEGDIDSYTFLNNKTWTIYLTSNKDKEFGIWFADGTVQPYKKNTTTKDTNKFKAYVTDNEYFEASLPPFSITNTSDKNYKKNPYLVAVMAAYVSTYVCAWYHLKYGKISPVLPNKQISEGSK